MKFARRIGRMVMQAKRFGLMADRIYESKAGEIGAYWFSPEKLTGGASLRYVWLSADRDGVHFLFSDRSAHGGGGPIYSIHDWSRQRKAIFTAIRDWLAPRQTQEPIHA